MYLKQYLNLISQQNNPIEIIPNQQMKYYYDNNLIKNNNPFNDDDLPNLKKLLYDNQIFWYIYKHNNNIVACAGCKINQQNSLYINEFFSFEKGFGKYLLLYILSLPYNIIYLHSNWTQPESLNNYYRQLDFNLIEYIVKRPDYNIHYFYKNKKLSQTQLKEFIYKNFI